MAAVSARNLAEDAPLVFNPREGGSHYVCIRTPRSGCKLITINIIGISALTASIVLSLVNKYEWQNRVVVYVTGLTFGASSAFFVKLTLSYFFQDFESGLDEIFHFISPIVFQGMTQWEINAPVNTPAQKQMVIYYFFSFFATQLGYLTTSQAINILSAGPSQLSSPEHVALRSFPLLGNPHAFLSVLKFQAPSLVACGVLFAVGIWKNNSVMVQTGAFLGGRTIGVLGLQQLLYAVDRLRAEFNSGISASRPIPPTKWTELWTTAYKIFPYTFGFFCGVAAAKSNLYALVGIGAIAGGQRIVRAHRFVKGESETDFTRNRNQSICQRIWGAVTPFPAYIYSSDQRAEMQNARIGLDIFKGVFTMSSVMAVNGWMTYWLTQFKDTSDRAQLITAGTLANLSYLFSCIVYSLCMPSSNILTNSLFFQFTNMEDLLGPLYLIFFNAALNNGDLADVLSMWVLWSSLLIAPLVITSKEGRARIITTLIIFYMWSSFTGIKFLDGTLQG